EHYEARLEAYNNRLSYIREIMVGIIGKSSEDINFHSEALRKFEEEVFGEEGSKKADIFFDAYPIRGNAKTNKLFAFENITPHSMFKDPTPLRLLKVIPDVIFEFRFLIKDSVAIPEMTKEKKAELFKRIISDLGMGAKTNVGFGIMEEYTGDVSIRKTENTEQSFSSKEKNKNNVGNPNDMNKGQQEGKCKKCGRPASKRDDGSYFALCKECSAEAPKCKKCNKKKVNWDSRNNKWYPTCPACR
ncbi:MAG: type III-B CRISPR module RAMP protein Cmr6, partial [Lachnospiraceae bacterium]|nr:type III-B CRISPR module RAMP protein Cmr6 [Lachnospiraceae bacterium]